MELLNKLYNILSPSRKEEKMIAFITDILKKTKVRYYVDKVGNIYVTKGKSSTFPCLVAHMDEVHLSHPKDFTIINVGDDMLFGFSPQNREYVGIGADDKNGIWICLKCLEEFENIKCVFFVSEEIGCIGSGKADMNFFNNCRFVLQCDRKGNSDFITKASGIEICSSAFFDAVKPEKFGYKQNNGAMTDVQILKQKGLNVACANISCGYYHPHQSTEFTNIPDLLNCLVFVKHIIKTCTKTYKHKYIQPVRIHSPYLGNFDRRKNRSFFSDEKYYDDIEDYDYDNEYDMNKSYSYIVLMDTLSLEMEKILIENSDLTLSQIKKKLNNNYSGLTRSDYRSVYQDIMGCSPPEEKVKTKKVKTGKDMYSTNQTITNQETVPAFIENK